MKKISSIVLSLVVALNIFPACVYASNTLQGDGTLDNPYIIGNAADYQVLADSVKNGESYSGDYFIQTADFEFDNAPSGGTVVYGMGESEFAGIYDGKGYTITLADDYKEVAGEAGLGIKKVEGGLFGNLTGIIKNVTVNGSWRLSGNGGIIAKKVSDAGKIINCGVTDLKALHAYDSGARLYGLASSEGYNGTALINCFGYFDEYIVSSGENYPLTDNGSAAVNCYYYVKSPGSWEGGTIAENADQAVGAEDMASLHSVLNENIELFEAVSGVDKYSLMLWENGGLAPVSKKEYYADPAEIVYDFEGEGTAENPYIIADMEDYQMLSAAVKGGVNFSGMYFAQTADFEFDNAPSGGTVVYGMGDSEFAGIYDGKGYTITLADDYKEVAGEEGLGIKKVEGGLFGNLTGIIKNVTVKGSWRLSGNGGIIAKKVSDAGKIINCGVTDFKALHAYDSGTRLYGLASTADYSGKAMINCFGYYEEYIVSTGENYAITDNGDAALNCYYYVKSAGCWESGTIAENADQLVTETKMSSLHSVLNENIGVFEAVAGIDKYSLMLWKNGGSAPVSKGEYYIDPVEIEFEFKGEGTYEDPYLIETIADYNKMTDYIKNGDTDFKGKYFSQTGDIAFETAKKDQEVVYGLSKGDEFAGIYNGNGYSITLGTHYNHIGGYAPEDAGITMLNQGLFGKLSGVVMNVVIRGIWRMKGEGGLIAHTVVDNGKIINCGTRNFGIWAIFGTHSFYGFASTKDYVGTAIYNCFFNSHYSSSPNAQIFFITDTDAYKDCWYHLDKENGGGIVDWTKGEKITAEQLATLDVKLNDSILENAKAAGVPAVDLRLWKVSDGAGSPIVENYELDAIPVPDNKTFTHISIESNDTAGAGKNYALNALTYFKDSDKVEVKIDGEKVLEYVVEGVYENIKEIPAQYITEGKHTVTVCGLSEGNVIYTAEKNFVVDAGVVSNIVTSGSLVGGSTISVTLDVENCLDASSDITLLLGVYNAKKGLVAQKVVKYPDVTETIADATVSVDLPEGDYAGGEAVLYIWSNLKAMKAMMAESVVLK